MATTASGSTDLTFTNNTINAISNILDTYGYAVEQPPGTKVQRLRAWYNILTVAGTAPLKITGNDFDIRYNIAAKYAGTSGYNLNMAISADSYAVSNGGARYYGGGNISDIYTALNSAVPFDMHSAAMNGSPDVVASELPRISSAGFPSVPPRPWRATLPSSCRAPLAMGLHSPAWAPERSTQGRGYQSTPRRGNTLGHLRVALQGKRDDHVDARQGHRAPGAGGGLRR